MREDLLAAMSGMDNSEAFDSGNDGHVSFVLYEIIRIFRALKVSEIQTYSKYIGLDLKLDKVKRLLFFAN